MNSIQEIDKIFNLYVLQDTNNNYLELKENFKTNNSLNVSNDSEFIKTLKNELTKYSKISVFRNRLRKNLDNYKVSNVSQNVTQKNKIDKLVKLFDNYLVYIQELIILQIKIILYIYHNITLVFNFMNKQIINIKSGNVVLSNLNNSEINAENKKLENKSFFNIITKAIMNFFNLFKKNNQVGSGSINLTTLQNIKSDYEKTITDLVNKDNGILFKSMKYLTTIINAFETTIKKYNIDIDNQELSNLKTSIGGFSEEKIKTFLNKKVLKLKTKYENNETKDKVTSEFFYKAKNVTPDDKIEFDKITSYVQNSQKGGFIKGSVLLPESEYNVLNVIKHFI